MKGTWIHDDTLAATIQHHYIIPPSHKFNGNDIKIAFGDKVLVDMFGFQPFQNPRGPFLPVCKKVSAAGQEHKHEKLAQDVWWGKTFYVFYMIERKLWISL